MRKLICSIVTAILVLFSPLAFSQPGVQAEADKILKGVEAFMSSQKSAEIEAAVTEDEVFDDTQSWLIQVDY